MFHTINITVSFIIFDQNIVLFPDPASTYLEAACYIMNTIHAAEVSADQEILCTAYATAVVHMKEKAWLLSYFTQVTTHTSH